jgi:capsular exopolysaccharide synthesis family protein
LDVRRFLRILRKRYPLIVLALLLSVSASAFLTSRQRPTYQSGVKLYIASNAAPDTISENFTADQLAIDRAESVAELVTTGPVLGEVYRRLGIKTDFPGVNAEVIENTVLIQVDVFGHTPAEVQKVASTVGEVVPGFIANLERPTTGQSPIILRVAEPAGLPRFPVAPNKTRNVTLGALFGIIVGFGAAFIADALDTSVRTAEDVGLAAPDTPIVGTLLLNPGASKGPLVTTMHPNSSQAEAFRQLRTNIQFLDIDHELRSLVVTSPVANEGKSTTSANLAISLAQTGQRVIIVDGDLRRSRVAEYLGLEGAVGLTNVLIGQVTLEEAMQEWSTVPMKVLASGPVPPNPSELLASQAMLDLVHRLEDLADVVIFDSPPLLPVTDAAVLAAHTNGALLVVRANRTTRPQVTRSLDALNQVGAELIGVVLNFIPDSNIDGYGYGYQSKKGHPEVKTTVEPRKLKPAKRRLGRADDDDPSGTPRTPARTTATAARAAAESGAPAPPPRGGETPPPLDPLDPLAREAVAQLRIPRGRWVRVGTHDDGRDDGRDQDVRHQDDPARVEPSGTGADRPPASVRTGSERDVEPPRP